MSEKNSSNLPENSQEAPKWQPPQPGKKIDPKPRAKPKTTVAGHIPSSLEENEIEFIDLTQKIYMRSVKGRFNNWRVAMIWLTQILFYGLPWLNWDGRQIVLFDLIERKFYLFGLVLWPQDIFYLAIILIV